ncbi:MAG: riboflavin biosynthesis protein RibD, partial [Candidatus Omnitrophica bacterium]|nr:riboflavin biosynthesis protein RibD [Candidatus Omnitrophota bacterium]
MKRSDEYFMKLALRLALKGEGKTSPNPLVGALVVKNGKVITKGFHEKAGLAHAEIMALDEAGDRAKGATLYV